MAENIARNPSICYYFYYSSKNVLEDCFSLYNIRNKYNSVEICVSFFEWVNRLQHLILWAIEAYFIWKCNQDTAISFISVIILLKESGTLCSRKIELWTTKVAPYCLEIWFNRNNDDLRWWCCLEKEGVENERCGFANKKSQIERLNYQVR